VAAGVSAAPGPLPREPRLESDPTPRLYRRTRGSRLLAAAAAVLFGGLCLHALLDPPAHGAARGALVCGALLVLSLLLVVMNFGDRIEAGNTGIRFRNVWRERLGWGRTTEVRWEDVREIRDLRRARPGSPLAAGQAFLVRTRSGRRVVFDSIEGIQELEAVVRERAGLSSLGPAPSAQP